METEELVKKAKQGDREALVQLIMAEKMAYYKLAYVYMKNEEDAMDALQDMIVVLYENIYKLEKEAAFYSWSKTILVNRCKVLLNHKNRVRTIKQIKEEAYEGDIDQKNEQIALENHLSKLNKKHQEVIRLRYFLDLEYQSIASILNIPLGTVKSRLNGGLKKLKESLGGEVK